MILKVQKEEPEKAEQVVEAWLEEYDNEILIWGRFAHSQTKTIIGILSPKGLMRSCTAGKLGFPCDEHGQIKLVHEIASELRRPGQ